jgi:formylmethanofuran dehydrogenase subunit A
MFATPRYVVKGGTLVVEEGQLRRAPRGRRLHVRPGHDSAIERPLREFFDRHSTVSFRNYPVGELRDTPIPVGRV